MAKKVKSYFEQRLSDLGVTPELNKVTSYIKSGKKVDPEKEETETYPIFTQDENDNINIHFFNLFGTPQTYKPKNAKNSKPYFITRLKEPQGDKKYNLPAGAGTMPFIPPGIIKKYHNKEVINTLFLTEGAFKTFKGDMHGIDIVGLTSITHIKEKESGNLHPEIIEIIKVCKVLKVVWLTDGDCLDLSTKAIEEKKDLSKRPRGFFSSIQSFHSLFGQFENVFRYFVHIKTNELEKKPKGLDDLLIAYDDQIEQIKNDLLNLAVPGSYFQKFDITFNIYPVHRYFKLNNVNDFISFHAQARPEIVKGPFVFYGTTYEWNDKENRAEIKIPGEAKNYFRVGDQYYKYVEIPNKYNQLEKTFHKRSKETIVNDHGKKFVDHIPRYESFCVVPNHMDYQPVVHNCFNMYFPFEHEPLEGDCDTILEFIKHIFGNETVSFKNPLTQKVEEYKSFELGLDYIQILYQKPTQILPILCLVSKENNTGKSTFAKFLKLLFTQNAAIIGNAELASDFNSSWASKLMVICDEAMIDKKVVVEKVKALSTADKIFMNSKGRDHLEMDFFAKFIFITNNEDTFIYANENDIRFWVRKINPITSDNMNVNVLQDMQDEIPAFIHYLNNRKLSTTMQNRAHFHPELIKTEALQKLINRNKPSIAKEIEDYVIETFFEFGLTQIYLTKKLINDRILKKKVEGAYLNTILHDVLKVNLAPEAENKPIRFFEYTWENGMDFFDDDQKELDSNYKPKLKTISHVGRPYKFRAAEMLDEVQFQLLQERILNNKKHEKQSSELF